MSEAELHMPPDVPPAPGRLARLSHHVMRAEAAVGGAICGAIFLLMLASATFRGLRHPLIWADELAVHLMVCLAFLGASLAIALRGHMTMGLLPETLPPRPRAWLALAGDLLILLFLLVMALVIWRWLDLPGLIRAGSGAALAQETFSFIYTDPTQTLGVRKIWFWLIMPVTCLTGMIHVLAQIAGDLRELRRP